MRVLYAICKIDPFIHNNTYRFRFILIFLLVIVENRFHCKPLIERSFTVHYISSLGVNLFITWKNVKLIQQSLAYLSPNIS